MIAPSVTTIKRLFALSGNRCAFPDCTAPLIEESETVTGEICHIHAASQNGPRFDKTQTDAERHASANLILLCPRHHKIVDSEPKKYTVSVLEEMKRNREQPGLVEISPTTAKAAQRLLDNYLSVTVQSNSGQIAIQSPGAVQANTINIKTSKSKLVVAAPPGSIADDRKMLSYGKYLVNRYQEFQKGDSQKAGDFKYIAIHNALKRQFKCDWKLLPSHRFEEVVTFLRHRIDNTKLGRINGKRSIPNYHSFAEHS
jgi:hypothetical protein